VRDQLGYTQEQFASRFGISVATLRHWERGDRRPNGPALVLLNLIARDPQAVGRLLSA
jgi:putative transcriptional regulator